MQVLMEFGVKQSLKMFKLKEQTEETSHNLMSIFLLPPRSLIYLILYKIVLAISMIKD